MLLNDLYSVTSLAKDENSLSAEIRLDQSHGIFEGHFPGNPVLPGVCLIQIAKELLGIYKERKLMMIAASSIKYIAFINPEQNNSIRFGLTISEIPGGTISCSCNVTWGETVFCKLKSEYSVVG